MVALPSPSASSSGDGGSSIPFQVDAKTEDARHELKRAQQHDSHVTCHDPMRDVEMSAGVVATDVTMKELDAAFDLPPDLFCTDVVSRNKKT